MLIYMFRIREEFLVLIYLFRIREEFLLLTPVVVVVSLIYLLGITCFDESYFILLKLFWYFLSFIQQKFPSFDNPVYCSWLLLLIFIELWNVVVQSIFWMKDILSFCVVIPKYWGSLVVVYLHYLVEGSTFWLSTFTVTSALYPT